MTVSLEIVPVRVDLIDPNPWNPNVQTDVIARATRESLEHFGFVEPVLLRPKDDGRFEIVNGEHRWKEAQGLGIEEIPAVVRDLADDAAKKLTVILNETTGDPDIVLLGRLLAELQEDEDFRIALPYTETELAHLLSLGADDWDAFADGDPDPDPLPDDGPEMKDVTLTLTLQEYDQFRGFVMILEKELGTRGTGATVLKVVCP